MFLPGLQPDQIDTLLEEYAALSGTLALESETPDIPVLPGSDCTSLLPPGELVRLTQGTVEIRHGDRVAMILQAGDYFLIPATSDQWPLRYHCEEPGTLSLIGKTVLENALENAVFAQRFTRLLMTQSLVLTLAYAVANRYGLRPKAGFQRQPAGSRLIAQGTEAHEVYTLMRGRCRVEVAGIQVGSIEEGDIFGVLAALTGSPRTADVIAETDVTLMAVPRDQFIRLIQAQPETFLRLLRTLSRHIDDLNQRLVDSLRNQRPRPVSTNVKS
ncbi:Crp/Fnr family transcriptional regulator [Mangrovitalea sediminis]|uniref:Crp/Fnr family transcriptional regulator n=1 Tax=Mangrovitalea sediminis TaxID=1982043 RepID=UPI000BE561AA|nr:cyclic nucleotide-binding domain-containing protein [Mangrovitalea sediminis]